MQNSQTSRCEILHITRFTYTDEYIQIPVDCIPWPAEGLRRASVNSFGFGGSNSHAILEDAFHFLRLRGLKANHCTSEEPPQLSDLPFSDPSNAGQTLEQIPGSVLAGDIPHMKQNGALNNQGLTNGYEISGDRQRSDHEKISSVTVLVWSAADDGGLLRLTRDYQNYFSEHSTDIIQCDTYLKDLAYTLGSRRSSLPWKTFAIVDSVNALSNIKNLVSKAYRSSGKLGFAFIFTGQGAQYKGMGTELLRYHIFESTLRSIDNIFRGLGCQWSLFGMCLFPNNSRTFAQQK